MQFQLICIAVSIVSRVAQISLWHFRGLDYEGEGDSYTKRIYHKRILTQKEYLHNNRKRVLCTMVEHIPDQEVTQNS